MSTDCDRLMKQVAGAAMKLRSLQRAPLSLAILLALFTAAPAQQPAAAGNEPAKPAKPVAAISNIAPAQTAAGIPFSANDEGRYRIGPGDVLEIRVMNRPNLSRDAVRVEGNGTIRMPLIEDDIPAACSSEGELAKEITKRYLKFYRNPQVDVFVKEYHSQQVAVVGEVNDPGRFLLQRRVRLLELLSYAKGPSPKAGQTINVVHTGGVFQCGRDANRDEVNSAYASFKLSDTLRGDDSANPYLENGDIVHVPKSDEAYVVGNVFNPVTIALNQPITVSRAIAMAGGIKQDTKKDHIRIVRQEPGSSTKQEIPVDLNAIEKKSAEDVALRPNDIVDVPSSTGRSLIRSLIGGIGPAVTSLPVRVVP